jgi:hypothetical protein
MLFIAKDVLRLEFAVHGIQPVISLIAEVTPTTTVDFVGPFH